MMFLFSVLPALTLTGFGKKTPERMEIAVGGKDAARKIRIRDSRFSGRKSRFPMYSSRANSSTRSRSPRARAGRARSSASAPRSRGRKATGKRRHVGSLGAWHPGYVHYTVPMAGQMGYHKRTEINKRIMKMGAPAEINPDGGFTHYGVLKNDYLLIKGSVAGPQKRLIRLRRAVRKQHIAIKAPELKYVSLDARRGIGCSFRYRTGAGSHSSGTPFTWLSASISRPASSCSRNWLCISCRSAS